MLTVEVTGALGRQSRRLDGDIERWAHHFMDALRDAGQLYDARWRIGPARAGRQLRWLDVLRPLATPDDGRVKAYVKQLRDGVLAPVLVSWVRPMDCYILLDGHDRLAAGGVDEWRRQVALADHQWLDQVDPGPSE